LDSAHEQSEAFPTAETSAVTSLLLVMLLISLPVLSLLGDLGRRDLERSRVLAEAALRRAQEKL